MSELPPRDLVANAAARAAHRPFYLASAIATFQELRDLDDGGLLQFLNCSMETLNRLRLCRRPDADSSEFRSDVRRIADAFAIDPTSLLCLLRETASVDAMRGSQADASMGFLMAARDKPRRQRGDDTSKAADDDKDGD
jgi:hypothetical protein